MQVFAIVAMVLAIGCSAEAPPPPLPPAEQAAAVAHRNATAIPPDIAERSFADPLSIVDAESILMATQLFDMAEAGFRPGRQVQAFNVVLDQRDAANRFRRLAREARVVGQLYALCGLLAVARAEGVRLAHSLSLQEGTVSVREGDFIFDTSTARAIVLVFANELPHRLRNRRDEAYQYFRRPG